MKKALTHPNPYRYLEAPPELIVQLKAFQACGADDPEAAAAWIRSLPKAALENAQELWELRPRDTGRAAVHAAFLAFLIAGGLGTFAGSQVGASLANWMLYWTFACLALAILRSKCEDKCLVLWRADYFAGLDRLQAPPKP